MWHWFRQHWPVIPIVLALILLIIAWFLSPSNFLNLAWFTLVALTAVYAYAAVSVIRAASKQAEATKRMIDEMRQSRLDVVKPSFSLQPGDFTLDDTFSSLYLKNSGGVARKVQIDIEIGNTEEKHALFVPAIDRDNRVYLPIKDIGSLSQLGSLVKVFMNFMDSSGQSLTETLFIDFSELKKEGRQFVGQYSELDDINRVLERIERSIENIERKIWSA